MAPPQRYSARSATRAAPLGAAVRPRILLVTPQPYYEERGTPIAVGLAARALVGSGFDVDILAFPLGETATAPGIRIERCGNPFFFRRVPIGFSARKLLLDVSLLRKFEQLLAHRSYVAVHAVEEAAWLASVLCPMRGIPFVYDMASAIPEQLAGHRLLGREPVLSILRSAERRVIQRAAHVVCSSGLANYILEQSSETAVTEWRFPVTPVRVDPLIVSELRRQYGIRQDDRVLLYAGNFSRYQGIDLLLEAFARAVASDPGLMLVCVGAADGQAEVELTSTLAPAVRDRIRIVVRQPRTMMPVWFGLADALVSLRTCGENVPLKLFEYMAAGKPIIATRGLAHQPLLNDSRAYLCVADPGGVADAIHRLFGDTRRAQQVGDQAADYAARNFSWNRFRDLVAGIYQSVVGTPASVSVRHPVA